MPMCECPAWRPCRSVRALFSPLQAAHQVRLEVRRRQNQGIWSAALNYSAGVNPSPDLSCAAFVARYKTANTRTMHTYHLTRYLEWLEELGVPVTAATTADIMNYLDTQRPGRKEGTVTAILKSIRAYYKWITDQGAISHNPAARIPTTTPRTQPPMHVRPEDVRKMLDATVNERDWAFIAILTFGSLRVNELCNCDISDLEFEHGRYILHFKPLGNERRRPTFVILTDDVAAVLISQLDGRQHGPLFLGHQTRERLNRRAVFTLVRGTARRAGLTYPVSPQMLTHSLPAVALQRGYSYRGVARAMGVPDRRHSERWLGVASDPTEDNASVRLARFVLTPPDTPESMLMHAEALILETDLSEPFAVMATGAIVERHLRLLGVAHGIPAKEDSSKGSITYYVGELQRQGVVNVSDARQLRALGDSRNDAAHGWFERIEPGTAIRVLREARSLIARNPLP